MASTGTHPAATMLFRIVDVPAEIPTTAGPAYRVKQNNSVHNSVNGDDRAIGIEIFTNYLMVKATIVGKLKIA